MLESAQDLSLKAFVAARCAARQLAAEESSKAAVADLEAKVATLEKEKEALQWRLDKSSEEKATLTTELLATADRAVKAEDAAKAAKLLEDAAEKQRALMHKHFHSFKESLQAKADAVAEPILAEAPTADAEGGGDHAGGGATPPSGDDGDEVAVGDGGNAGGSRGATDRAPAVEDQAMGGSSHPAAGEV
ncbi:myristoylated alanine-rich C-kinase substrate-like [Panicum virgatum]|uniref:myristoylated alanine-rich C-kinase substrate-like n=1 Tax=Panicum virgatum TaxID=38727 RepID=UPI0019D4F3B1|nr:myristoylated alanine-rich C-kinase substrate-like [Panicum virgatum]